MDLPELFFLMAFVFCLCVPILWPLAPVAAFGYMLVAKAERVANDVRDTSAPGSVGALIAGIVTIGGAGAVVLLAALAVGGVL